MRKRGEKSSVRGRLASLMSTSSSAGLQSMSVISPGLVVDAMAITVVLPIEDGRGHNSFNAKK